MYGSRVQVFRGSRKKTTGGLTKPNLTKNSKGKIVSRKASASAKKKSNLGRYIQKKQPPKPRPKASVKAKPQSDIPKNLSPANARKWFIKKLFVQKRTDAQINAALKTRGFKTVSKKTLAAGRAWIEKKLKKG